MELKDFITETLTQMMEGELELPKKKRKNLGAIINPPSEYSKEDTISMRNSIGEYQRIQTVEFDVSLTSTSTSDTKKGISVAFAGIGVEGGKGNNEQNAIMNRIKFTIPIALPNTWFKRNREYEKIILCIQMLDKDKSNGTNQYTQRIRR